MFLGKWNRSVVITYVGVIFAVAGVMFAFLARQRYAICCLIVAGVCDLFDGMYARSCKRTSEEKEFGVQLDSLADVMNFVALPIAIFIGEGLTNPLFIILYGFFAVCGVARLAYFNMTSIGTEGALNSYTGLPVTYTALIVPFVLLLRYVLPNEIFTAVLAVCIVAISVMNILKIKIKKPRGIAYAIFSIIAIGMLVTYMVVLW